MKSTDTYKLINNKGVTIEFLANGGKITKVIIPEGKNFIDISLGYDTPEETNGGDIYMGAICGRVANRIGKGEFSLDGKTYKLFQNDRSNSLHGGEIGYNQKNWKVSPLKLEAYTSAFKLSYLSADGEENFPGNLNVEIIYALNDDNEFLIDIKANTDKTTMVNLTSHPYFNLNGVGGGKVFNHELYINANSFTPLNELSVPTGEIRSVKNTDMDFTHSVKLSDRINSNYEQIKLVGGLDHNWVIDKEKDVLELACRVTEPESGRGIEVYTTQPGIQVYTSMHFDGMDMGKANIPFTQFCGIALEAQNFPDAPNQENFPSAVLKPDEEYREKIIYKFNF